MPRLKKLTPAEADERSHAMLRQLEKNKSCFNIFRSMANSPACLAAYVDAVATLKDGKLDARTRESISLVVAQVNGCEYCLSAHTPLARAAGLTDEAICDARQGRSANRKTQAALNLAKKMVESCGSAITDADVRSARAAGLDDGMIAEVVANVALNVFTNYFNILNQTEIDHPHVTARTTALPLPA
jgi:uncharacterized peroxidase-related enzyme